MKWTMGEYSTDRWIITDGRIKFDVHQMINGSLPLGHPEAYIVTPEQATKYAHAILDALNKCEVSIDEMDTTRVPDKGY